MENNLFAEHRERDERAGRDLRKLLAEMEAASVRLEPQTLRLAKLVLDLADIGAGLAFYGSTATGSLRLWHRDKPERRKKPGAVLCGAKTRKGTPCACLPMPGKARCKFHGGLSTGAKTPEGKARIAESNRRRAARRAGLDTQEKRAATRNLPTSPLV